LWYVETIEFESVELDFRSSGQGTRSSVALESGGVRLVNSIDLLDLEDPPGEPVQVIICDACGCTRCAPGGWVVFRRIGTHVLWIPAWNQICEDKWGLDEYAPPQYVESRGAVVFGSDLWKRLRCQIPALPSLMDLPPLATREIIRTLQWCAPGRVLGRFPEKPRLRRESVLAVSDGDLELEVRRVNERACELFDGPGAMEAPTGRPPERGPIEFILDVPGFPSWAPFVSTPGGLAFWVPGAGVLGVGHPGPEGRESAKVQG
jgi:hypothetical protein